MTSQQWNAQPVLEKGFYYLVKSDLFHLKKGMRVRVMNAQYHQAPKSDEGGYNIDFPDNGCLRLNHQGDRDIIKNITAYLEKQEPFDWNEATEELKNNRAEAMLQWQGELKSETYTQNKKAEELVLELVAKGMTHKEAYKHLIKNRLIK